MSGVISVYSGSRRSAACPGPDHVTGYVPGSRMTGSWHSPGILYVGEKGFACRNDGYDMMFGRSGIFLKKRLASVYNRLKTLHSVFHNLLFRKDPLKLPVTLPPA